MISIFLFNFMGSSSSGTLILHFVDGPTRNSFVSPRGTQDFSGLPKTPLLWTLLFFWTLSCVNSVPFYSFPLLFSSFFIFSFFIDWGNVTVPSKFSLPSTIMGKIDIMKTPTSECQWHLHGPRARALPVPARTWAPRTHAPPSSSHGRPFVPFFLVST